MSWVLSFFKLCHLSVCVSNHSLSASLFPSMNVQGPHHLFNPHHLICSKLPRVFCSKSMSPTPFTVKGVEVKQMTKRPPTKQKTEEIVNYCRFFQLTLRLPLQGCSVFFNGNCAKNNSLRITQMPSQYQLIIFNYVIL